MIICKDKFFFRSIVYKKKKFETFKTDSTFKNFKFYEKTFKKYWKHSKDARKHWKTFKFSKLIKIIWKASKKHSKIYILQ